MFILANSARCHGWDHVSLFMHEQTLEEFIFCVLGTSLVCSRMLNAQMLFARPTFDLTIAMLMALLKVRSNMVLGSPSLKPAHVQQFLCVFNSLIYTINL